MLANASLNVAGLGSSLISFTQFPFDFLDVVTSVLPNIPTKPNRMLRNLSPAKLKLIALYRKA